MRKYSRLVFTAILATALGAYAKAAKTTGHTTAKAAEATGQGTQKAIKKTANGTRHVAKRTAHGVTKGVKGTGRAFKTDGGKPQSAK